MAKAADQGGNLHNHPGGAYGYRIEARDSKVLTYCTDVEHGDHIDPNVVGLSRGADLLIHGNCSSSKPPISTDFHRNQQSFNRSP